MTRIIFIYGLIAGAVTAAAITVTILLPRGNPLHESLWVGYLIMLVALSAILVGVKQYRDDVQGGVISFGKALLVGLGIAAVARCERCDVVGRPELSVRTQLHDRAGARRFARLVARHAQRIGRHECRGG